MLSSDGWLHLSTEINPHICICKTCLIRNFLSYSQRMGAAVLVCSMLHTTSFPNVQPFSLVMFIASHTKRLYVRQKLLSVNHDAKERMIRPMGCGVGALFTFTSTLTSASFLTRRICLPFPPEAIVNKHLSHQSHFFSNTIRFSIPFSSRPKVASCTAAALSSTGIAVSPQISTKARPFLRKPASFAASLSRVRV